MCQSVQRRSSESGFARCPERAIYDRGTTVLLLPELPHEEGGSKTTGTEVIAVVDGEILDVLCRGRRSPNVGLALAQIYVRARE